MGTPYAHQTPEYMYVSSIFSRINVVFTDTHTKSLDERKEREINVLRRSIIWASYGGLFSLRFSFILTKTIVTLIFVSVEYCQAKRQYILSQKVPFTIPSESAKQRKHSKCRSILYIIMSVCVFVCMHACVCMYTYTMFHVCMHVCVRACVHVCMYMDGWMDGWMRGGWMGGWMGWMDGWMDGWI